MEGSESRELKNFSIFEYIIVTTFLAYSWGSVLMVIMCWFKS